MSTLEQSIDVALPVRTVYDQWTQFEEFPSFMDGVEEVHQLDDTQLHWVARIAGMRREWHAEITEQIPDERIAWRSRGGANNAGVVSFQPLGDTRTRVRLELEFEPTGLEEQLGDATGLIAHRAQGDLECFRDFLETRGTETGAWRGEVRQDPRR
jgi:uncharacterized membrane protein